MDEGFTSYAQDVILQNILPKFKPFAGSYNSYYKLVASGKQEPLTTHADHYKTNRAYGTASYSMGLIFLHQLSYVVGEDKLMSGMKRYFNEWKFKHPTPNDFIRVIEKESGMELNWYLEQWIETTNTIDYGINSVKADNKSTIVTLEKIGEMPMPVDLLVKTKDGKEVWINIPLRIMRSQKAKESFMNDLEYRKDWPWTFEKYELALEIKLEDILSIEIDPSKRMADIDRSNNSYPFDSTKTFK